MKITLITPNFTLAGVPIAQVRFAQALANKGFDVDLIIGNVGKGYTLPSVNNVNIIVLDKPNVRGMFISICSYMLRVKPDIIFSAEDHLNNIVLLAAILTNSKTKISCSSRVTPYDTYSDRLFSKRWILKQLTRIVSWRANVLTCVSSGMIGEYEEVFGKKTKHVCVYNAIVNENDKPKMLEPIDDTWFLEEGYVRFVAAGRLDTWKGYEDLIHAISHLDNSLNLKLLILGDGPLRNVLQDLINDLNLTDKIHLKGYVTNPLKYFYNANYFIHSAHVESLGNVLVEAMMCGCTVVSTDCPTGPREILNYGKYGYLTSVKNPCEMAKTIIQAIDNPIPKSILKEAIKPFTYNKIIERHFELLGIEYQTLEEEDFNDMIV